MEFNTQLFVIWTATLASLVFGLHLVGFFDKRRQNREKEVQAKLEAQEKKRIEQEQKELQKQREEEERKKLEEEERVRWIQQQQHQEALWSWKLRMQRDHLSCGKKRSINLDNLTEHKSQYLHTSMYDYPLYWRCDEVLAAAATVMDVFTIRTFLEAGGNPNATIDYFSNPTIFERLCKNWIADSSTGNTFWKSIVDVVIPLSQDENDELGLKSQRKGHGVTIDCPKDVTDKECLIIAKMLLLCGASVTPLASEHSNTKPETSLIELIKSNYPTEDERHIVKELEETVEPPPELARKFARISPDFLQMEPKMKLPLLHVPKKYKKDIQDRFINPPFGKIYFRPAELMEKAIYFVDVVLLRKLLEAKMSPNIYVIHKFQMITPLEYAAACFNETMCSMNWEKSQIAYYRHSEPEDRLICVLLLLLAGAEMTQECMEFANTENMWKEKKLTLVLFLETWQNSQGMSQPDLIQKMMKLIFPDTSKWGKDASETL